jgi:microcystin-dependent protein
MFCGNFAPVGWAFCDGNLMPIAQFDALFNLIGTTYGGDGQTTFGLPDLRGRAPIHQGTQQGNSYQVGESSGVETVTLTAAQIPAHSHSVGASSGAPAAAGTGVDLLGAIAYVPASPTPKPKMYAPPGATVAMSSAAIASAGGSQPHNNMAPFLAVNFIICLEGIFPSQF